METVSFRCGDERINLAVLSRFDASMADAELPLSQIHSRIRDFNAEHGSGVRLIRPLVADFLFARLESTALPIEFRFPTDAAIAYEAPGTALGKKIAYTTGSVKYESVLVDGQYRIVDRRTEGPRIILPTGKYEGEKGIALVAPGLSSDDFKTMENDIVIDVPDSRLIAVPAFPEKNACYRPHSGTSVPSGAETNCGAGTLFLFRKKGACVCPIARDGLAEMEDYLRHNLYADSGPVDGIVVEVPEKDLGLFPGEIRKIEL